MICAVRSQMRQLNVVLGSAVCGLATACALAFSACAAHPGSNATSAPLAVPPAAVSSAAPFDWRDAILYFVIVDRFADGDPSNDQNVDRTAPGAFHGGDLRGLTAHLDEIASLGANAVWITPVVKNIPGFVTGAGFPDWGYHGYWADDFNALDPRFGSESDLKALVDAAHSRGIKVLLDVVYNHVGYNSHYVTDPQTKNWIRSNETGGCGSTDLTLCVAGLPDLKTELPAVDEFLFAAYLPLAKRVGLDGFRLDTVKHVDHPFWQEHRRRVNAELGERFFLLGEVWGGDAQVLDPYFEPGELDGGFDFGFQGSVVAFVQGRGRAAAFDRYLASRQKVRAGHLLAHFLSSHDVKGGYALLDYDPVLFRLAALLQMTSSGIPTIYYGEEVGRRGGEWPQNRSDMPWGSQHILPGAGVQRDEAMRDYYRRLIAIRKAHRAFGRGTHEGVVTEGDTYVFERSDAESRDDVFVAINRGEKSATVSFPAPQEWTAAQDELNQGRVDLTDGTISLELTARSAAVVSRRS